jgi:hypothetical protein
MILAGPANDRALWRRNQALIDGRPLASAAAVDRNTGLFNPPKENEMSKGQHGNKEAKKPKKASSPITPLSAAANLPTPVAAADRQRKK